LAWLAAPILSHDKGAVQTKRAGLLNITVAVKEKFLQQFHRKKSTLRFGGLAPPERKAVRK
jgi:hypothetical protein